MAEPPGSWTYEPYSQRRARRIQQQRQAGQTAVQTLQQTGNPQQAAKAYSQGLQTPADQLRTQGDARSKYRETLGEMLRKFEEDREEKKKEGGGGFLGGLKSFADKATPEFIEGPAKSAGKGALTAVEAVQDYGIEPIIGASLLEGEQKVDPETGEVYRTKTTFLEGLRGVGQLIKDPAGKYGESRQAYDEFFGGREGSVFGLSPGASEFFTEVATDPLTYLGPGALRAGVKAAGLSGVRGLGPLTTGRYSPLGAAIEGWGPKTAPFAIAGGAAGAEVSERQGWGTAGQISATLGGALAGGGFSGALRAGPGNVRRSFTSTPAQVAEGERVFLPDLDSFDDVLAKIGTDDPAQAAVRALGPAGKPIDRSAFAIDPFEKSLIAVRRQWDTARKFVENGVVATLDANGPDFGVGRLRPGQVQPRPIGPGGWLFDADEQGLVQNLRRADGVTEEPRQWHDVIYDELNTPGRYALDERQRKTITDIRELVAESNEFRIANNLEPLNLKEGFDILRQVRSAQGVAFKRPSDPTKAIVWDQATDAVANGVEYSNDIHRTLEMMILPSYRQVIENQLSTFLEPMSRAPTELMPENVVRQLDNATEARRQVDKVIREERLATIRRNRAFDKGTEKDRRALARVDNRLANVEGILTGRGQIQERLPDADLLNADIAELEETVKIARQGLSGAAGTARGQQQRLASAIQALEQSQRKFRDMLGDTDGGKRVQRSSSSGLPTARRIQDVQRRVREIELRVSGTPVPSAQVIKQAADDLAKLERSLGGLLGRRSAQAAVTGRLARDPLSLGRRRAQLLARQGELTAKIGMRELDSRVRSHITSINGPPISARLQTRKLEVEAAYQKAKARYSARMAKARSTEKGPGHLFGRAEDQIPIQQWNGRFFEREKAERLTEELGRFGYGPEQDVGRAARVFEATGNITRFASAIGDLAAPMIQGLPTLGLDPVAWSRSAYYSYRGFLEPNLQARYIREHIGTVQEMARAGIPMGDVEFFRAIQEGGEIPALAGAINKMPVIGKPLNTVFSEVSSQTLRRFQASYDTFLTVNRIQLWESMKQIKGMDEAQLARLVRNMTGGLDTRALGIGPSQRGWESMWLGFSPRLLRSTLSLVSQAGEGALSGDPAGRQAINSLLGLASVAGGLYVATGLAAGEDWEDIQEGLNPLNGKRFLSHNINGQWIGVGGQVRAITQFAAKMLTEPGDITELNRQDNPLLNFWESRGAVGVNIGGAVVDATLGSDILRYEDIDSYPDALQHIGTSMLPFAVQGILEGEGSLAVGAGFLGGRTSPGTPFENLNILSQAKFNADWDDLEPVQKDDLKRQYPEAWQFYVMHASEQTQAVEQVKETLDEQQEFDNAALFAGEAPPRQWVESLFDRRTEERIRRDEIFGDTEFSEPETGLEMYWQTVSEHEQPNGKVDWEAVDAWLAGQPEATQESVIRNSGRFRTPMGRLFSDVYRDRLEFLQIPKYRGFSADEGYEIDRLIEQVRAEAGSSDERRLLLAFNRLRSEGVWDELDENVVRGVRMGIRYDSRGRRYLRQGQGRERYRSSNPLYEVFYGSHADAPLTSDAVVLLENELQSLAE